MRKRYYLKNRQRFLIFLVVTSLVLIFVCSITSAVAGNVKTDTLTLTVMPGDTLWDIAVKYSGDMEVREYIYHIKELNELNSALIYAGQRLYLP